MVFRYIWTHLGALNGFVLVSEALTALLGNLLNQKFSNPHDILDSLCEHVHCSLKDLETRIQTNKVYQ